MADIEVDSTSTEGYATTNVIGEWELAIDATGEEGPDPNQVLVADYASCFIPAFRVGANKEGFSDIGTVNIEAYADIDEEEAVVHIYKEALGMR